MNTEKSKGLREGAMMVALTVILVLLTWYVPMFSLIGTFACAVPMACLSARCGLRASVPAVVATLVISALFTGSIVSAVSIVLMSVLPGAIAGYFLGRRSPFFVTLFGTCAAVCVGWIAEILLLDVLVADGGIEKMFAEITGQFSEIMKTVTESMESEGAAEAEKIIKTLTDAMGYTFRLYFPSLVIISSMVIGYIIIMLCAFVIKRTKSKDVKVLPFSRLKAPKNMSTVAVIAYICYMLAGNESTFSAVLANVVLVLYAIIGICGLSLLDSKLGKKIKSGIARIIIYAVVFLFGGLFLSLILNALVIAGILDSAYNFRKIDIEDEYA